MDHRRSVARTAWVAGLGFGLCLVPLLAGRAGAKPQEKVTICHANNSVADPYVQHTVNQNSIVMPNGQPTAHGLHTGPVYPLEDWGDVVPPFTYTNDHGGSSMYHGMNWESDGQAIWNGGCEVDLSEPPEETTTTTTTTATTTIPAPTTTSIPTTTTQPGSTTSRPGSTTTTTEPNTGTTPTTASPPQRPPPVTDPGNGVEITPPVEVVVINPGDVVIDLGTLTPIQRVELEAQIDSLAGTGQNTVAITLGALMLIAAGSLLLVGARRLGGSGSRHPMPRHGGAASESEMQPDRGHG